MKDDSIIRDLSGLKSDFEPGFSKRVIARLRKPSEDRVLKMWTYRAGVGAAASVALVVMMTYSTFGRVNKDSLIGVDGYSSIELSEGLDSYAFYDE